MKHTKIDRQTMIQLWAEELRKVPLTVMLTSAELESGIGAGRYDLTASRYEKGLQERNPNRTREDCTSWGLFQILGMNCRTIAVMAAGMYAAEIPVRNERVKEEKDDPGTRAERDRLDYVRLQMAVYDRFMGGLIRRFKLPAAYKRYNGSGPRAQDYMLRAMRAQARIETELAADMPAKEKK